MLLANGSMKRMRAMQLETRQRPLAVHTQRFRAALVTLLLASSCSTTPQGEDTSPASGSGEQPPSTSGATPQATPSAPNGPTETPEVTLANPASEHCIKNGGRVEMERTADGERGICVFPDGSRCEEWAYFRGECRPGQPPN